MSSTYDQLNGWGPDYDYWLALARRLAPESIVDLGCGTGALTVLLAGLAGTTTGVDPDEEMLAVARGRGGHDRVTWLAGYAADVPTASADLVTMTSHVSQVFLTDDDWGGTLDQLRRALRPGGRLAFDMRNPHARGWEEWNPIDSRRSVVTDSGPAEVWHEVTSVADGLVSFDTTTRLLDGSHSETATSVLCFRDEAALRESLTKAGFAIETVHGDWDSTPATSQSRELIVTARRLD